MEQGIEKLAITSQKPEHKIFGLELNQLINDLYRFEECFNQVIRNNIPRSVLDVLIGMGINKQAFISLERIMETIIHILDSLIDEENREKYQYKSQYLNVPIQFTKSVELSSEKKTD